MGSETRSGEDIARELDASLREVSLTNAGNLKFQEMQRQLNAVLGTNLVVDGYATLKVNNGKDAANIDRLSNTQTAISEFINQYAPELAGRKDLTVDNLLGAIEEAFELKQDGLLQKAEDAAKVENAEIDVAPVPDVNLTAPEVATAPQKTIAGIIAMAEGNADKIVTPDAPASPALDSAELDIADPIRPATPEIGDTAAALNVPNAGNAPETPQMSNMDLYVDQLKHKLGHVPAADEPVHMSGGAYNALDLNGLSRFVVENADLYLTAGSAFGFVDISNLPTIEDIHTAATEGRPDVAAQMAFDAAESMKLQIKSHGTDIGGTAAGLQTFQDNLINETQRAGFTLNRTDLNNVAPDVGTISQYLHDIGSDKTSALNIPGEMSALESNIDHQPPPLQQADIVPLDTLDVTSFADQLDQNTLIESTATTYSSDIEKLLKSDLRDTLEQAAVFHPTVDSTHIDRETNFITNLLERGNTGDIDIATQTGYDLLGTVEIQLANVSSDRLPDVDRAALLDRIKHQQETIITHRSEKGLETDTFYDRLVTDVAIVLASPDVRETSSHDPGKVMIDLAGLNRSDNKASLLNSSYNYLNDAKETLESANKIDGYPYDQIGPLQQLITYMGNILGIEIGTPQNNLQINEVTSNIVSAIDPFKNAVTGTVMAPAEMEAALAENPAANTGFGMKSAVA